MQALHVMLIKIRVQQFIARIKMSLHLLLLKMQVIAIMHDHIMQNTTLESYLNFVIMNLKERHGYGILSKWEILLPGELKLHIHISRFKIAINNQLC